MNQHTDQPSRRAPPQMFGRATAARPDFEESILATIDGRRRPPQSSARKGSKKFILLCGVAVVGITALTLYFGSPIGRDRSMSPTVDAHAPKTVRSLPSVAKAVPAAASAPTLLAITSQTTASIENVIDAAPPAVVAAPQAPQAIVHPIASPPPAAPEAKAPSASASGRVATAAVVLAVASTDATAPAANAITRTDQAPAPINRTATARPAAKPQTVETAKRTPKRDADADLLAAMLPYLNAQNSATSPGLERRCGQSDLDAARACRAKYCNGREGTDAACPVKNASDRPKPN